MLGTRYSTINVAVKMRDWHNAKSNGGKYSKITGMNSQRTFSGIRTNIVANGKMNV